MKDASAWTAKLHQKDASWPALDLQTVSSSFVQLQERRHSADYDISLILSRDDAARALAAAEKAFESWNRIKGEKVAHEYLFSLLFKDR